MRVLRRAKAIWDEFAAVGATTFASSIAYYTFLSLVPLLALCISLISLVGVGEQEVLGFLAPLVPDVLQDLVAGLVSDAFGRAGLAFSLSTLSLLWSASKGTKALRAGLNAAYAERETRGAIAVALISVLAVVAMATMIAAAMWAVFGNSVLNAVSARVPELQVREHSLNLVYLLATLSGAVLMTSLCYTFLPAGRRSFTAQLPGAAFALAGFGALSFGFRLYVEHLGADGGLYGSMATITLLLFWLYLIFCIIIAGGFLNRYLQDRGGG